MQKKCPNCGKNVKKPRENGLCYVCWLKTLQRACAFCGKTFQPKAEHQKFCTSKCLEEYYTEKRRLEAESRKTKKHGIKKKEKYICKFCGAKTKYEDRICFSCRIKKVSVSFFKEQTWETKELHFDNIKTHIPGVSVTSAEFCPFPTNYIETRR